MRPSRSTLAALNTTPPTASGQPTMALTGHAAEHLARLTPAGHEAKIHLTLSDEHPYALAFVVIEALPQS